MKKNKDLEYRNTHSIELRDFEENKASRTVCGYAIRFNEESEDLGFYETIEPTAITQEQIDTSDIFECFNHDQDKVLARRINGKGTLNLEVREDGVYFEFEAPHTELGNELLEHIKRGEIFGSSFCFSLPEDGSGEKWEKKEDGTYYRTITRIDKIYETSVVYQPAYSGTSCGVRSKDKIKQFGELTIKLDKMVNNVEEIAKY